MKQNKDEFSAKAVTFLMADISKLHSYECNVSQQIALRVHMGSDMAGQWPLRGSCCVASASCGGVSTVNCFGMVLRTMSVMY